MVSGHPHLVLRHIRQLVEPRDTDATTDSQLLQRFVAAGDETAFATLVQRHGPLVLGVCYRVLDDTHAAEDAFQAVFLLLVRKAGSIGRPELLSNWLYGVALRVARKARAAMNKRRLQTNDLGDLAAPASPTADWHDVRPILDEEVERLPAKYRLPILLCCLQGQSNEAAARQLGWPIGTVWGRLSRAREMLRQRLTRRGVALSTGTFTTLLAANTASAVAPGLVERTVRTAVAFAQGSGAAAGVVTLVHEAARDLMFAKLKSATTLLIAATLLLGASVAVYPTAAAPELAVSAVAGEPPSSPAVAAAEKAAVPAELGAGDFKPSVERPIGWRGDGTGRYPGATPPTVWGRRAISPLLDFRCQAAPPADGAEKAAPALVESAGAGACHFAVTDWLVIGPFDPLKAEGDVLQQAILPKEEELEPREGDKVGALAWQRAAGPEVNLTKVVGKSEARQVVYASTHIYTPQATGAGLRVKGLIYSLKFKAWINGKAVGGWDGTRHPLQKGWNRLLLKIESPGGTVDWLLRGYLFAFAQDVRYETKNIRWTTPLPGPSYAMPIVVGDKLFLTSEPNDLVCVDKTTGRVLWMRSHPMWSAVDPADKDTFTERKELDGMTAKLEEMNAAYLREPSTKTNQERRKLAGDLSERVKKVSDKYRARFGWGGGNAGPTPCSDGEFVYVWHGETGVLACCDLNGKDKWVRFHHPGRGGEHGINASPVIVGDKIVVLGGGCVLAFDRATGKEVWRQGNYRHPCYSSLVVGKVENEPVVVAANGSVYRVADGKLLQGAFGGDDGECASPVLQGNRFFLISRYGFCAAQLPERLEGDTKAKILNRLTPKDLKPTETYPVGSPVCHEDLVYATHSGWGGSKDASCLFALSPLADKPVYRQYLDFHPALFYDPKGAGSAASLVLAGKHLYVMDNRGTTIVVEPGSTFKSVAKNTLVNIIAHENHQEVTQSTPIFEGKCMYYRAEENLYCVSEEGGKK